MRRLPHINHAIAQITQRGCRAAFHGAGFARHVQRQQQRAHMKSHNGNIGVGHAQPRSQRCTRQRAKHARRILRGARHTGRADDVSGGHGFAEHRIAQHQIRRAQHAQYRADQKNLERHQRAGDAQRHGDQRGGGITRAQRTVCFFVADALAGDAQHRRHQRAQISECAEQRQHHHRFGFDEDEPGEQDILHLLRPRGHQIRRPLKAKAPHAEGREHRGAYGWCGGRAVQSVAGAEAY